MKGKVLVQDANLYSDMEFDAETKTFTLLVDVHPFPFLFFYSSGLHDNKKPFRNRYLPVLLSSLPLIIQSLSHQISIARLPSLPLFRLPRRFSPALLHHALHALSLPPPLRRPSPPDPLSPRALLPPPRFSPFPRRFNPLPPSLHAPRRALFPPPAPPPRALSPPPLYAALSPLS